MRKQRLFIFMTCMVLGVVSGCNKPVKEEPVTQPSVAAPSVAAPSVKGQPGNEAIDKEVLLLTDPDGKGPSAYVEVGGTLVFGGASTKYPKFEIQFVGANPYNDKKDDKLSGSNDHPIVVNIVTKGDYKYKIRQIKADGTAVVHGPFLIFTGKRGDFDIRKCPPACGF